MVRVCPAWRGDLFQIHRSFVVSVNYGGSIRTLGLVGQFIWVFTEAKLVPSESGMRSCCNENSNSSAKISYPLHTLSRHRVIKIVGILLYQDQVSRRAPYLLKNLHAHAHAHYQ